MGRFVVALVILWGAVGCAGWASRAEGSTPTSLATSTPAAGATGSGQGGSGSVGPGQIATPGANGPGVNRTPVLSPNNAPTPVLPANSAPTPMLPPNPSGPQPSTPGPAVPPPGPNCAFQLGFAALHDLIPDSVGDCVSDEAHNPDNGDGLQQTTNGLLVWRKADNWTAFTDGSTTWINGPQGLARRANAERFCWEADSAADGCLTESGVTEPELPPFAPAPTTGPQATGQPTATVAGQVTVAADAPSYALGQPIRATVANGLGGTLYTADMKSGCSILLLERRRGEGWEPLVGCALERAPLVVAIDAGRGVEVTLDPNSTHFADPATGLGGSVTAGEYRLRVTYRLTPDGSGEESLEASSAPFRVGP